MAESDVSRVWSLIEGIAIAMVVTHTDQGLRARPMAARPVRSEAVIYFLTDAESAKDDEVHRDENLCLAFADKSKGQFVSITGQGEILNDREKIKQHWSIFDNAFWRDAQDPAIRLLCVRPQRAEYWKRDRVVVTAVKMIATKVTGRTLDLGTNEKVDFGVAGQIGAIAAHHAFKT